MIKNFYKIKRYSRLGYSIFKRTIGGYPQSKIIFVLGTGRSGTHWLGHILGSHPDISVTIEKEPMFGWSTTMALYPNTQEELLPKLIKTYRHEHLLVSPRHYADKSHPNIWIAEKLAQAFPEALFLGIIREAYPTVASMLKHKGVLQWIYNWEKYPVPNNFLGITKENREIYKSLSLSAKCAVRWASHASQLKKLQMSLGNRILVIKYEELQTNTEDKLQHLSEFIALDRQFPTPDIRQESLDRWQAELNEQQIYDIESILELPMC